MDDKLLKQVCGLIKKELRAQGQGYKDLAELLDISEVSIKRLLNNQQPLALQRLIKICDYLALPVSKVMEEAERRLNTVPLFSHKQDLAFVEQPALFTFWSELAEQRTVQQIQQRYELTPASLHLYLAKLAELELIELSVNNRCKLLVPAHAAFATGSKFAAYFTKDVVNRVKDLVLDLKPEDQHGSLTSVKAELTEEEFGQINHHLEEWIFTKLRESQNVAVRNKLTTKPYTFVLMGAQGAFHDELPIISNIAPKLNI